MSLQEERLYYLDSYLTAFQSIVREVRTLDGRDWVRLDSSAFYPTSGGQPYDTGWLGATRVTAVEADESGVWHQIEGELAMGDEVAGKIDWERRFDFMQQHNGQHILSACFKQSLGANTSSFHMGDEYSSIDLDIGGISDGQLEQVLLEANQWIWKDVTIRARFVTEDEITHLNLRKAPSVKKDIRIVTIEGLEDNACGGTHPASTGQVGQILVTKTERMRGGVRITFVCGRRALREAREASETVRGLAASLSVGAPELAVTIAALGEQVREANRREQDVRTRYAVLAAQDFSRETQMVGNTQVVVATLDELDEVSDLKKMASSVAGLLDKNEGAHLVSVLGQTGGRTHVVIHSSVGALFGADALIRDVLPRFEGKGGGNAKAAQGSAPTSAKTIAAAIRDVISDKQRDQTP